MKPAMNLTLIQTYMQSQSIDGWLLYDFRGSNPILTQLLPGKRWTTRRVLFFIPAKGQPRLLVHHIDHGQFQSPGYPLDNYLTWQDLRAWVAQHAAGRVAMEYSPGGHLPAMGIVDAGTVELVRSCGADVVSSANLMQASVAVWSPSAIAGHARASEHCARIMKGAFDYIRTHHARGADVTEHDVQRWIQGEFAAAQLETADAPIVAVNDHAGDPHFEVSATAPSRIVRGDWVLIDLWAREPGTQHIFSDITWVGYAGRADQLPARHRAVFEAVKAGRDAALTFAQQRWSRGEVTQGWQVDDAARAEIQAAGFGSGVKHRTGHSLSAGPKVHGVGVNIDNLETHDTRELLPGIGFTIEPGAYFHDLGIRLEIDVYMDPAKGPVVTSCIQDEIEFI